MRHLPCLVLLFTSLSAYARPGQVLIIRHGEEPESDVHLSARGEERAKALVDFFLKAPEMTEFGAPVAIYAASPKHADSSQRSIETVTPLAEKLHVKINTDFEKDQQDDLIEDLNSRKEYEGKTVVISWPHKEIPEIARKLGAEDAPKKWGSPFDRVWKIKFAKSKGGSPIFENLPQNLLEGDSER